MEKKELFKNVIGYSDEKKTLERIIDVLNNKEKYMKLGSNIPHGLFLYGPPGIGKTTIAKELLNSVSNRKVYTIRKTKADGDFINYMGEVVKTAKENQPSIILFDDLDKYAEDDDTSNCEEFVAVQSFIDDLANDDVFVIATANNINVLPDSLLRAGRFDIKLKLNYPEENDAYKIFNYYLKNKKIGKDVNIKNISLILGSRSCATLEKVCNQAGIYAGFKNKESIGMDELLRAALEVSYNTNIESEKDDKYIKETAYHEAGHAVVGYLLDPKSVSFITVLKTDSNTKGYTKFHNNDYYWDDIKYMENRVISLLAGKAATEIVFNKCDVGCNSDLDRAYELIDRFVDNYCMNGFSSWIRDRYEQSEKVKQNKDDEIIKLINKYYNNAKEILIANRDKLDNLADVLIKNKILFQDEIENILS